MSSEEGQINSSKINKMALRLEQKQKEQLKEQESILKQLSNIVQNDEKGLLVKQPLQVEEEESQSSYYYDEEDESDEQSIRNQKKVEAKPIAQKSIEQKQIQIQNPVQKTEKTVQIPIQKIQVASKQEESEEESYYDEEEENEQESEEKESVKEVKKLAIVNINVNTTELLADELDIAGVSMSDKHHEVIPKPKTNLIAQFQGEHKDKIDNWQNQDKKNEKTNVKTTVSQNEAYGLNIKSNPFFDIKDSDPESGELSPQFKKKSNVNSKFQVSSEINQLSHSFGVKQQDLQNNINVNLNVSRNSNSSKSSNLDMSFKSQSKDKTQEKQIEILNQSQTSVKNVQKKSESNEQGDELNVTITEVDKGNQKEMVTNEESAEEDHLNQEVYNKASGLVNNALVTFQSAFPYDKDNRVKSLKKILKAKTQKQQLSEQVNDTKPEEDSQELLKGINVKQTTFKESLETKSSKNSSKLAQFSKYVKDQNQKEAKIQEEFERFKQRITQEKEELFIDRPMVDARFQINEILKNRSNSADGSNEPENENKTYGVKVTDHFLQMEETPRSLKQKLIMSLNGSKLSLNGSKSSQKQEIDPEKNRTFVERQLKERYFDDYDHSKINDTSNSMSISENIDQHRVYNQINSNISQNKTISNASHSQKQNNSQASEKFEQFRKQIESDLLRISKNSKKTPSRTEVRDKANTGHDKKSSHSLSVKSCRVSKKSNQSEVMQSSKGDKKNVQNHSFDAPNKITTSQQPNEEASVQKEGLELNQTIQGHEDLLENKEQKDNEEEEDLLFGQLGHDDINLNNEQSKHITNDYQEQTQEIIQNQSGQQFSFIQQEQDEQQQMNKSSFSEQNHTNELVANQEEEEEFEYEQEEDNLEQSDTQQQPEQFSFQNEEIFKENFTEDNINQFHMMEETTITQEIVGNQSQDNEQELSFQPEQQSDDSQNLGLQDIDQYNGDYKDQQNFDQIQAQQQQISDNEISNDELNQDFEYDQEMQEEIEIQENSQINQNITQYSENYEHADEKDNYQEDIQNDEYDNLIQQEDQESFIQEQQKDNETTNTQEYQIESQIIAIDHQQNQNYQQNTQQQIHTQDLTYQLSEFIEQQEQQEQEEIVKDWQLDQNQNFQQEQYDQELNPDMADSLKRDSNTYTEVPSSRSSLKQEVNFHLQLENEKEDDQDEQIIIDQPYREIVQKQIRTQKQLLQKTPIVLPRPQTSQASRSKLKGLKLLSRNASVNSYSSLQRNNVTQQTLNLEFNNSQNVYQMMKPNQTIGMPLRRTIVNSSLEKQEEMFYEKIARLSIPVRQQIRANSSSTESRNKQLRSLERLKSGLKTTKRNLNKQKSEQELNKPVQERLKIPRTMSGLKIIKGRNNKIQTEEIKAFKIKISRPQTSLNRILPHRVLATSESQPQLRVSSPTRMRNYFDYKTMSDTISNEERAKRIMNDIETLYQIQNAGATFKVQRNNKRDLLALKSGYHQISVKKQGTQISFSNNQTMNISQGKAEYLPEESQNNYVEVTWRDVQNAKAHSLKVRKDQNPQGMQGLQQAQINNGILNKSSLARIKPHIFQSEKNPNSILAQQSSEQFLKKYQGGLLKQFKLEINNKSQTVLPKYVIKGQTPIKREILLPEDGDKEPSFCNLVLSRTKLYSRLDPRIVQSPFLSKLR